MAPADRTEYYRQYHLKNREKRIARMRQRYHDLKEMREAWRARNRAWYARNRLRKISQSRAWAVANKERRAAWHKTYWLERGKALKFKIEEGRFPDGFEK